MTDRKPHNSPQPVLRPEELGRIRRLTDSFPVTAILGPRQCGKSTLARQLSPSHIFDLENPADLARLQSPQQALEALEGLVAIDEIQRRPDLFPLLRYLCDSRPDLRFLILGSASRDLIRQSSETLAGRIAYHTLGGFGLTEVNDQERLWLRGGFPRAYLSKDQELCDLWLQNYVTTFLERDIPALGIRIPAATLRRFWMMLSHYHGQLLNCSELATSFGISDKTVRHYIEILEGTFMVRLLQPWTANVGKRLVKSPKLYLRDSGVLHALLRIPDRDALSAHPKLGASWEGFALEECVRRLQLEQGELFFWRPQDGTSELDLYYTKNGRAYGVEFKFGDAPIATKSMHRSIELLELEQLWVIYPGKAEYPIADRISAVPLVNFSP
jgi:predicted AAA+ superfamily ATPase